MLKSLYIQNFALIDSLRIGFDPGFSVISGETGAGKSIILGALSLILGQRADVKQIKQDAEKCVIEGVFDVSAYDLAPFFEEMDWVYEGDECILRREIWSNGKSRAFVNDSPVYLNDLKGLADKLIDIHSQHQNLSLNDNLFQLNVVDLLAGTKMERADYGVAYAACRASETALNDLREQSRKNREEEDYLRFQYAALAEMNLQPDEQGQLEEELEAVAHAEEIKTGLYTATALLSEEERSVESLLRTVADTLHNVQRFYPKLSELVARVDSAFIELKDVREEITGCFEEVEFDPGRRQLLEERLSAIYDLQKKHSVATVEELIALRDEMGRKLENIDSLDERLQALERETEEKRKTMMAKAGLLSEKRKKAAPRIEKELVERLAYLRMPNVRFQCDFKSKDIPDATGADSVQFLFSANKNVLLQPVSQIASGGEMSRLMLCIKAMIAGATSLPTIIFDEIDTGTSGEVADRVGTIMEGMGARMQVIGITHLPQIASKGTAHFLVYKEDSGYIVTTKIKELTPEERVQEIARMLSGAEITEQAIENAKVMLNRN
ncbi:DNA repair protein RecN [Proteiniphilum sp. X52]|uniref:DNA repair protein RecN n=1 Tax=Proteiniphilum sp. X52 TaxID=2382159 RepID=UPI000F09F1F8|nr:DNA repair protein RecN [Proteiniphilum sp. X52]RNC65148.1 DNA repair protein RecN [Proteiniphilum sp. X52]